MFITVAVLILKIDPNWMQFTLDEGIYITGALQVAHGLCPYVDFFALTGPGVYWLYGTFYKLFGPTLMGAHLILFLEIGWVSAILTMFMLACTRSLAISSVAVGWFVTITTCTTYRLYINHRWDSMLCATMVAGCSLLSFQNRNRQFLWSAIAGLWAAASIVITPTVVTVPFAIVIFFYISPIRRKLVVPFMLGFSGSLLLALLILLRAGALDGALAALYWNYDHYSTANRVWFGYFDIQAKSVSHWSGIYLSTLLLSLAPTLTVITSAATLVSVKIKRQFVPESVALAALIGTALIVATYPRMAANQIAFAVPFLLVPLAWHISRASTVNQRTLIGCTIALIGFLVHNHPDTAGSRELDTALGTVRCSAFDSAVLRNVQSHTSPGQQILVYPYLPILYALTGTQPVSFYSYLQPGMMDARDEDRVMRDCRHRAPSLIIWRHLEKEQMKVIWPNTDWSQTRFPRLEAYIHDNFHRLITPKGLPLEYWVPN